MSLISTLLPVLMRQQDFSLSTIGLLQFMKLPWILKLFWAPFVDRHTSDLSSYKRWIWGSEIAYALAIFAVAFFDLKLDFAMILMLVVLAFVCSATQDIATDGLTSRVFGDNTIEANRLQSMGQFAGSLVGGGVLMLVYHYIGWSTLFVGVAILTLALIIPLQYYRSELPPRSEGSQHGKASLRDVPSFFRQRGAGKRSLLLFLFHAGLVGSMAMTKPYLVDLGYSLSSIGLLFNLYGAGCGFLASFVAGKYLKALPRARALTYASLAILVGTALIALIGYTGQSHIALVILMLTALWGSYGIGSVVIYSVAMDYVRPGREGTDFTLQIIILHLSSVLVAGFSGKLSEWLGYSSFFFIEMGLALISLLYIKYIYNDRPNK